MRHSPNRTQHYSVLEREQGKLVEKFAQSEFENERLRSTNEDINRVRLSSNPYLAYFHQYARTWIPSKLTIVASKTSNILKSQILKL